MKEHEHEHILNEQPNTYGLLVSQVDTADNPFPGSS